MHTVFKSECMGVYPCHLAGIALQQTVFFLSFSFPHHALCSFTTILTNSRTIKRLKAQGTEVRNMGNIKCGPCRTYFGTSGLRSSFVSQTAIVNSDTAPAW